MVFRVSKTLVITEKPSVARDIAAALPGTFAKHEGFLESDEWVITYAVGHLVELADPEEYGTKFKRWRYADLPIVPDKFKLRPRDDKSRKQLEVIREQCRSIDGGQSCDGVDGAMQIVLPFVWRHTRGLNAQGRQA